MNKEVCPKCGMRKNNTVYPQEEAKGFMCGSFMFSGLLRHSKACREISRLRAEVERLRAELTAIYEISALAESNKVLFNAEHFKQICERDTKGKPNG